MEGTAPLKRSNLLFQEGERLDTLLVPIFVVLRTIMIRGFAFGGWCLVDDNAYLVVKSYLLLVCMDCIFHTYLYYVAISRGEMTDFYRIVYT